MQADLSYGLLQSPRPSRINPGSGQGIVPELAIWRLLLPPGLLAPGLPEPAKRRGLLARGAHRAVNGHPNLIPGNSAAIHALAIDIHCRSSIDPKVFGQLCRSSNSRFILLGDAAIESGLIQFGQRCFLAGDAVQCSNALRQVVTIARDLISMSVKVVHIGPVNVAALRGQAIGI